MSVTFIDSVVAHFDGFFDDLLVDNQLHTILFGLASSGKVIQDSRFTNQASGA